MPTTRSGASSGRGSSSAHSQIISMLKADHKQVKKCFVDFAKLDVHEDSEQCQVLVEEAIGALEMHAALEEELFYPAARNALDEEDVVDEAEVEHMTFHTLIEQLKDMAPEEEKYAATFKVLGEYVQHHIKEEEEKLFPQLSRARIDWDGLLHQMTARREELMEQFIPAAAEKQQAPSAKGKAKTKEKEKEKGKGRSHREAEEVEEETEEIAGGEWDRAPYAEPADDEE